MVGRGSFSGAFLFFEEVDDSPKIVHDGLQLDDGVGGEILRLGQFVAVFEGLVLDPADVELVAAPLDLGDIERTEPLAGLAAGLAVGILAIGLLEFGEMPFGQRAVLSGRR